MKNDLEIFSKTPDSKCTMGEEQEKLVLHDDFGCWVDGEYMGKVSKETIAKMPKAN